MKNSAWFWLNPALRKTTVCVSELVLTEEPVVEIWPEPEAWYTKQSAAPAA